MTPSPRPTGFAGISEAQFQTNITELCDWFDIKWHHETDSRRSKAGFPDLTLVGVTGLLFAELKDWRGQLSPDQILWRDALLAIPGAPWRLWRPADWGTVQTELRALAGMTHRSRLTGEVR